MARVGSAYSDYRLNLAPFNADVEHIRARMRALQAELAKLHQQSSAPAGAGGAGRGGGGRTSSGPDPAVAQQRAERAALSHAQALARLHVASGNAARGAQTLSTALAQSSGSSTAAVRAQTQLVQLQTRIAQGSGAAAGGLGRMTAAVQGLSAGLGVLAGLAVVQKIVSFGVEAVQAANNLEKTQATVRALSGSQERYIEVLNLARQGQLRYGGSLSDTLAGLGSLVNLSNRTSVSLEQLDNVARRLAIVDPLQGMQGATVALKEFLTGADQTAILSLVRRFELPKTALRALTDEALSTQEKLDALDRVLTEQGISSEVLSARTETAAAAFDRLSSQADNAKTAFGGLIALQLAPWADTAGKALGFLADRMTQLASVDARLPVVEAQALSGATSFDDYQKRIQLVNDKLARLGEIVTPLTQAQYNYAQSLIQTGLGADKAIAKAQEMNNILIRIGEIRAHSDLSTQAIDELANAMLRIAATGPAGKAGVESLALAFFLGGLNADEFRAALERLAVQQQDAANQEALLAQRHGEQSAGTTDAANAVAQYETQLQSSAAASVAAAAEAEALAQRKEEIHDAALVAASGMQDAQTAAENLALQLGITREEALRLINALRAIKQEGAISVLAQGAGRGFGKGGPAAQKKPTADALRAAMNLPTGSEQIAVQSAYEESERQRLSRSRTRARAAGAAKLSDQQKLNNQLLADQERAAQRMEDAEVDHYRKLLAIERDYAEKSLRQQKANEISKRQSRASFYDSLTRSTADIGGDVAQRISAEYEAAFQKSQEIAQSGNAKLAADYLALKQEQLDAETQYQQARAQAIKESQEAEEEEDRKRAAAEVERLDRIRELQRQADAEQEKQLLEGGDELANERARQLADEQARFEQQQADIALSAENAAARKINAAERSGAAIERENLALQRQAELYRQLGGQGNTATVTPPSPATAAPAQGAPPIVAATPEGGFWLVRDDAVVNTLSTTNSILTGGFDRVVAGLENVARRVQAVESAVRNIQSAVR